MKKITKEELLRKSENERTDGEKLDLSGYRIENMDLSGLDLKNTDFSWSDFENVDLSGADLENSVFRNSKLRKTDLSYANLSDADLFGADFRGCSLRNAHCGGTDFTASILLDADLEGLEDDDRTVHFRQSCPEEGYFFGYKKCCNDRMVKLLIPADAKRSSSTTNACRCDKAKVVAITDLDGKGFYKEANSFVDENFVYRLGEMCYADSYNEDRWLDSSHGIHFWMSFEEALSYM